MLWRHLPIWDVLSGFGCLFQKLVLQMLPFRDTSSRRRRIIKLDWGSFMIKFHRSSPPWNRGWNLLALTSDSKKALTSPRDAWRQLYGASMHSGPASINSKSMAQYVFFQSFADIYLKLEFALPQILHPALWTLPCSRSRAWSAEWRSSSWYSTPACSVAQCSPGKKGCVWHDYLNE